MPHPFFHVSIKSWRSVVFLVLCVMVGFAGGIFGGTLSFQKDDSYQVLLPPAQQFPVILDPQPQDTREQIPTMLLQKYESSFFEVWNISELPDKKGVQKDLKSVFLGYCLGITSDGWLVTSLIREKDSASLHIFDRLKKEFLVQKRIDDRVIGVTYLKIDNSTIRPIQFSQRYSTLSGKYAYMLEDHRAVSEIYLTPPLYPRTTSFSDSVQNTSFISLRFNPSQQFRYLGVPFVSNKGELLGISDTVGVIPAQYIQDSVEKLLRGETSLRTSLAMPYNDIRSIPFSLSKEYGDMLPEGAVLVLDKKGYSVSIPQGGTFIFKDKDRIKKINTDSIDINRSFAEIVHQYKKGDNVTFTIQRNGSELIQKVILP